MTKVLVIGDGRMGTIVRELVEADESLELAGVIGIDNKDELADATPAADVAIDFSHKSMLDLVEAYVNRTGAALVSGTTGYDEAEMDRIRALGEKAPVIHSANYSLGVAVLRRLAAEAAKALPDDECDVVYGREGMCGKRPAREIGVHALRGGTVAGTHTVHFFGEDEEVALTHRATSRRIFASGAVAAAKKLVECEPGFYGFDELMF